MARYTTETAMAAAARGITFTVYLDGDEVPHAIEADDDLGFVIVRTDEPPLFRAIRLGEVAVKAERAG
jgi:hypothetical protein